MTNLYVCHFSNGHIKVGRSVDPVSRVAQHEQRVSCLGVEMIEHFIIECGSHVAEAESALIDRCASSAIKRNKNEWFEGLDYPVVCEWAQEAAFVDPSAVIYTSPLTNGVQRALAFYGGSPTKMAAALGNGVLRQHVEYWLRSGRVVADKCPLVRTATGIPLEELNDKFPWAEARAIGG